MWREKRNVAMGHGQDCHKGREVEVEEETEERNLKVEEKMHVFIVKLRIGTQDNAINHRMCH